MSDDCGPARLRGLPLDLLGLAVVQSNKELDKDKEDKEDKEEKELAEEEERRLGTLGWAGTAILAQPPSRPPSPPHPTTPPDFYLFLLPGLFFATFFYFVGIEKEHLEIALYQNRNILNSNQIFLCKIEYSIFFLTN